MPEIEVGQYNLRNNYQVHGVLKVTDENFIISELEKKHTNQHIESDSHSITSSDHESQQTVGMKDPMSVIGDNETPLSTVKQKLMDVYDVEECSTVLGMKSHNVDVDDTKEDNKIKTLIPKVEKE